MKDSVILEHLIKEYESLYINDFILLEQQRLFDIYQFLKNKKNIDITIHDIPDDQLKSLHDDFVFKKFMHLTAPSKNFNDIMIKIYDKMENKFLIEMNGELNKDLHMNSFACNFLYHFQARKKKLNQQDIEKIFKNFYICDWMVKQPMTELEKNIYNDLYPNKEEKIEIEVEIKEKKYIRLKRPEYMRQSSIEVIEKENSLLEKKQQQYEMSLHEVKKINFDDITIHQDKNRILANVMNLKQTINVLKICVEIEKFLETVKIRTNINVNITENSIVFFKKSFEKKENPVLLHKIEISKNLFMPKILSLNQVDFKEDNYVNKSIFLKKNLPDYSTFKIKFEEQMVLNSLTEDIHLNQNKRIIKKL